MAHAIFVCHSARDKPAADAVVHALETAGIPCWIAPRNIAPGATWATSIVRAIESSRLIVLMFSVSANDSEHVRREIERAVHYGIPIAPVRLEDVLPTEAMEYFLSSCQWTDAFGRPWDEFLAGFTEHACRFLGVKLAEREAALPELAAVEPARRPGWRMESSRKWGRAKWGFAQFSSDERTLVTGNFAHLYFWDVPEGKARYVLNSASYFQHFGLSADGALAAVSELTEDLILVVCTRTGSVLKGMRCEDVRAPLAVSPNGQLIAAYGKGGLWVLDLKSDKTVVVSGDGYSRPWFSPSSQWVITVGAGSPQVYEAATGRQASALTPSPGISRTFFSLDGRMAVCNNYPDILDTASGHPLCQLDTNDYFFDSGAFSPDGSLVAIGTRGRIQILCARTGHKLREIWDHHDTVSQLAFSSSGKWLVSASHDESVRVWDAVTGQALGKWAYEKYCHDISFSSSGRWVVARGIEGSMIAPVDPRDALSWLQIPSAVGSIAFNEDGSRYGILLINEFLKAWCTRSGAAIDEPVPDDFFTPSKVVRGMRRAIAGNADNLHVVAAESGDIVCQVAQQWESYPAADLTVNGHVAAVLNRKIHLWDGETGQELTLSLEGNDRIEQLRAGHASDTLVATTILGHVLAWNLENGGGKPIFECRELDERFYALELSRDDRCLLGITQRGVVIGWEVNSGRERFRFTPEGHATCAAWFPGDTNRLLIGTALAGVQTWSYAG